MKHMLVALGVVGFVCVAAPAQTDDVKATKPCRTSYRSPWQNPLAERWIGGSRRELFDHVVVLNESHAVRLARAYIGYFHEDRTHLGLGKDTPSRRPVTLRPSPAAKVLPMPRLGGLHHRYEWREAA